LTGNIPLALRLLSAAGYLLSRAQAGFPCSREEEVHYAEEFPMARAAKSEVKFEGRPVWVEIRLGVLQRNLKAIARHLQASAAPSGKSRGAKRVKILAVVKGNGYGHGIAAAARAFAKAGADWFGVTDSAEGAELRAAGIRQPVLVLTGFWPGEERRLIEHQLTPAVTRCDQLRLLERAMARARRKPGRTARLDFHLKIDSGMNRLGIAPSDIGCFARTLAECPHLRLAGAFTHFASSDSFITQQTEEQERVFRKALEELRRLGLEPGLVHLANSAAVVSRPATWADMVRPGAILYGYHQFYDPPERREEAAAALPLEPALSLRTRVISLRTIGPGAAVGYGARFVAERPTRIAVLSAGYADGLRRELTNRGRVLIRGRSVPLVGTISMDLAMADVTEVPGLEVGEVATIYGPDGRASQYVSDVARQLGTVSSDLLCSIGKRVPRIYLD
jgi:alanine racemase